MLALSIVYTIVGGKCLCSPIQVTTSNVGTIQTNGEAKRLAAAAGAAIAVEHVGQEHIKYRMTATINDLDMAQVSTNVMPGLLPFSLDVREPKNSVDQAVLTHIFSVVKGMERARGVRL